MEDEQKASGGRLNPVMVGGVVVLVIVVLIGGALVFGMNRGGQTEPEATAVRMETGQGQMADMFSGDEGGEVVQARIIEVEGGSYYFEPNVIRVSAGERVRIVLNSVDMMHDFVIDELGVRMAVVQAGQSGTVEFVVDEAGEYEFYCSVNNHRAQGMVGTLIVE